MDDSGIIPPDGSQYPDDDAALANNVPTRRRPPAAGKRTASPPAHVVQLRVSTVARGLVDGMGRSATMQAIAKAQGAEAAARQRARTAGAVDDVELNGLVPYVWGDVPIPERTVDSYIARAKGMLADEGKRVSRQREFVLALQLARLNETYMAAFQAKRFHTCLGVIKEVNLMFGMREAISVMLLAEARAQSDASREDSGVDLSSEQGKMSALSALIQKTSAKDPELGKVFARFSMLNSTDVKAAASTLTEHAPPKANGSKSNGSKSNGAK